MSSDIVLISISKSELQEMIRNVVQTEINRKKEKELLNSKELCDWLGIHLSTLAKWKSENKIPYRRMGKRIFFNRNEVIKALEESNYNKIRELRRK
jgi:excisionase family DNA binding protein